VVEVAGAERASRHNAANIQISGVPASRLATVTLARTTTRITVGMVYIGQLDHHLEFLDLNAVVPTSP
jgi:hypothetical protein